MAGYIPDYERCEDGVYIESDSDVISVLAGFRRHLVGKALINIFHCGITEIHFVGNVMIIRTFS